MTSAARNSTSVLGQTQSSSQFGPDDEKAVVLGNAAQVAGQTNIKDEMTVGLNTTKKRNLKMAKNTAAFGIYRNRAELERGVDELKAADFRNADISVLFPDNQGSKEFAHEKNTKAPEGATTGATTGALLGGGLGWLVGIGALAIPGIGPVIAAGPIVAALAGIGAGGAVGGLTGALIGAGIPEYEAKRYEGRIKDGGILLSVHCDSSEWTKKAKEILERTGAQDVASRGEAHADFDKSDRPILTKQNQESSSDQSKKPDSEQEKYDQEQKRPA